LATTEKHKIIPTILSRCQIYDFSRISVNDTVEHLQHVAGKEGISAEPQALNVIAQKSDGGMRDALSIFDQVVSFCGNSITYQAVIENLNVLDYDYYFRLTDVFLENKVKDALLIFNEILNKGFDAHNFVGGLSAHLRDVLMCKDPDTVQLLEVGITIRETYVSQAQRCSNEFLYGALSVINECDLNFRLSRNKRLLTELMLIRLCQLTDKKKNEVSEEENLSPIAFIPEMHMEQPPKNKSTTTGTSINTTTQPSSPIANPKKQSAYTPPPISISINKPIVNEQEAKTSVDTFVVNNRNTPFTREQLLPLWICFANEVIPEKTHAKNILLNNQPTIENETRLKIVLDQVIQQNALNEIKNQLISYLSDNLQNDYIELLIEVDTAKENTKVMSQQDRFAKMAEINPVLARLRKEFGLEID
jgi:DNA polymerase-3 subunit gamma/tau